jgi:hypothetical protein
MRISSRRWILIALAAAVVFYVGLYLWGTHSEGYRFLDQVVRESPEIRQRVGDVKTVRMSFLNGYREKFVNSESTTSKTVTMTLNVVGSKKSLNVKAVAKETNGTWKVSEASIDGELVKLN